MHLVQRMTMAPARCMICGMGNVPDGDTKIIGPFIDLGLDYNWGDSGYLCMKDAGKIAALAEWVTPDEMKDVVRQLKAKETEIHELKAKYDILLRKAREQKKSLLRISQGKAELKKVRRDRAAA